MSSTSWEGIFTTIRNLFHTSMFIFSSLHICTVVGFFKKNDNFFYFLETVFPEKKISKGVFNPNSPEMELRLTSLLPITPSQKMGGDLFEFLELLFWSRTMSEHTPCCSACWISILGYKYSYSWTKFFWTNLYCKCATAFSIFRIIGALSECQEGVQCTFCKLRDPRYLRVHKKRFLEPNSFLEKVFFAYCKYFEWFEHIPHLPHFCKWETAKSTKLWMITNVACLI